MINSSDHIKLIEMYRRIDNCHDYRILEKYIEIIANANADYPHHEFTKLLQYAVKRRDYEFNAEYIGTVDIDLMEE